MPPSSRLSATASKRVPILGENSARAYKSEECRLKQFHCGDEDQGLWVRLVSPGEFAKKHEGCEACSGEDAGVAGSIVKSFGNHRFRRHGERPGSVGLENCRCVRAKVAH